MRRYNERSRLQGRFPKGFPWKAFKMGSVRKTKKELRKRGWDDMLIELYRNEQEAAHGQE